MHNSLNKCFHLVSFECMFSSATLPVQDGVIGMSCIFIFFILFFFVWVMLRKGHGGLYKAPTKEERRKQAAKRIER